MLNNFFIDFETFYDVGYSLRQLSYTDYIHDDRFEVLGASVAFKGEEPRFLTHDQLVKTFRNMGWQDIRQIGHNNLFDGYIMSYIYGIKPARYFCTMALMEALLQGAASVGLDNLMKLIGMEGKPGGLIKGKRAADYTPEEWVELVKYANNDLVGTMRLFAMYSDELPQDEWEIMHTFQRMFHHPQLEFDTKRLNSALQAAKDDRNSRIASALDRFTCTEADLKGNLSFAELIERTGIAMPMKPSPSKPDKMIPALAKTDRGFQKLLEHTNEDVKALAEGRLAVKSTQGITRAQRFIDLDNSIGKCPVAYNYYRAHTGRVTGGNKMNATNLGRGSELRKSIVAPDGFVLSVADSSQIEARSNGYLAGQEDLMQLFRDKRDPYNDMAETIFGRPVDRKGNPDDFMEGFIGKSATLGLGFQMGAPRFMDDCNTKAKVELGINEPPVDVQLSYRTVTAYRRKNDKIVDQWETAKTMLERMVIDAEPYDLEYYDGVLHIDTKNNKIWFPNGTFLYYPMLDYSYGNFTYINQKGKNFVVQKIYGGKAVENIVQKFARDIVIEQMMIISKRYDVVMHSYDENVALIPEQEADEGLEWMLEVMKTPPTWAASLPLDAEGGYAKEYSK